MSSVSEEKIKNTRCKTIDLKKKCVDCKDTEDIGVVPLNKQGKIWVCYFQLFCFWQLNQSDQLYYYYYDWILWDARNKNKKSTEFCGNMTRKGDKKKKTGMNFYIKVLIRAIYLLNRWHIKTEAPWLKTVGFIINLDTFVFYKAFALSAESESKMNLLSCELISQVY